MLTRAFWAATGERMLGAFLYALAGAAATDGTLNVLAVDWQPALGIAAGAALLCLVKCVAAAQLPPAGSPALVGGRHAREEA